MFIYSKSSNIQCLCIKFQYPLFVYKVPVSNVCISSKVPEPKCTIHGQFSSGDDYQALDGFCFP